MSKDVYMKHKNQRQLVRPLPQLQETNGERGSGESELQVAPGVAPEQEGNKRHGGGGTGPHRGPDQSTPGAMFCRKPLQ